MWRGRIQTFIQIETSNLSLQNAARLDFIQKVFVGAAKSVQRLVSVFSFLANEMCIFENFSEGRE